MAKKDIGFKDFLTVDYAPGMPDLIKRNAKKRKASETETSGPSEAVETKKATPPGIKAPKPVSGKAAQAYIDGGKHAADVAMGYGGKHTVVREPGSKKHIHVFQYEGVSYEELDEALNAQQRRKRAAMMRRISNKLALGKKRAANRFADPKRLKSRAMKAARKLIFMKLTKGIPKEELTYQRRQEIEKRMDGPMFKQRLERLAMKLIAKERSLEMQRHASKGEEQK